MQRFLNTRIMNSKEIERRFLEAYEKASRTSLKFPPDIMLKFYAYYKQATEEEGIYKPAREDDVRNAFKLNALLQVKGMSSIQAKEEYINMVEKFIVDEKEPNKDISSPDLQDSDF